MAVEMQFVKATLIDVYVPPDESKDYHMITLSSEGGQYKFRVAGRENKIPVDEPMAVKVKVHGRLYSGNLSLEVLEFNFKRFYGDNGRAA